MPSTSSVPASTSPLHNIWLDLLPPELRTRIAIHVSNGKQNEDALHLAESTPLQRSAVLSALQNKLTVSEPQHVSRWTAIFHSSIRHVCFVKHVSFPSWCTPHPLSLLSAPTLHRAEISDSSHFLQAIAHSQSLRLLRICVQGGANTDLLLGTLRTLRLTELQLWCTEKSMRRCPIREMSLVVDQPHAIAAACDGLTALRMHCYHGDPIWELLPTFPTLRKVIVESKVPETVLPLLRRLESVQIIGANGTLALARQLGSVVTLLVTSEHVDAEAFSELAESCPRLSDIEFIVAEGVEEALFEAAQWMSGLRSLKLRWAEPSEWGPRGHKWNVAKFCGMNSWVMRRAVGLMPELDSLDLLYVRVEMEQLEAMLKKTGRRLKHFGTSIADQEEPPLERLSLLLNAVIAYNPELESLNLDSVRTDQMAMLGIMQHENATVRARQRVMLSTSLKLLKRAAPLLDVEKIEEWTRWYFLD